MNLVFAACTWQSRRMEQIVDIPVPQTEEEIEEVNQLAPQERIQQHTSTGRPSLCGAELGTFADIKVLQA